MSMLAKDRGLVLIEDAYEMQELGYNYRMIDIQAALGALQRTSWNAV
ncbi:hypothetical protein [Cohnella zeiphila]|nr:hypothetical protein [Cohnella zeiphila]